MARVAGNSRTTEPRYSKHGTIGSYNRGCRCQECKDASSTYWHNYRKKNPSVMQGIKTRKRNKLREISKEARGVPCADCGVQYPSYVMQFDHKNRNEKNFTISNSVGRGDIGYETLLAEIEKCDVVCANCHAERTFGDGKGWRK